VRTEKPGQASAVQYLIDVCQLLACNYCVLSHYSSSLHLSIQAVQMCSVCTSRLQDETARLTSNYMAGPDILSFDNIVVSGRMAETR
jgi:hypothetical protein